MLVGSWEDYSVVESQRQWQHNAKTKESSGAEGEASAANEFFFLKIQVEVEKRKLFQGGTLFWKG